jgi:hypothetical protein
MDQKDAEKLVVAFEARIAKGRKICQYGSIPTFIAFVILLLVGLFSGSKAILFISSTPLIFSFSWYLAYWITKDTYTKEIARLRSDFNI